MFIGVTRAFNGNIFKARLWAKFGYETELPTPPARKEKQLIYYIDNSGYSHCTWQYEHITLPNGNRVLFCDFGHEGNLSAEERGFIEEFFPKGLVCEPLNGPEDFPFMSRRS
jgi:hypothetical protein